MFPWRISLLFFLFETVYSKVTITLDGPREGKWSESKAKACGYRDFNGPIVYIGNFTRYGLTLHDFNENTRVTVHLNNSASFYKLKNVRTPLKDFELNYNDFLMNNTLIYNSYREYRNIFQRGLDLNNKETSINAENEALHITIIQTLTLKQDGNMKLINYVAASSDPSSDDQNATASTLFKSFENTTELPSTKTDLSGNASKSSENETESSGNVTESNNTNIAESDKRKFLAQSSNDCAEVCVQVTSIDITM